MGEDCSTQTYVTQIETWCFFAIRHIHNVLRSQPVRAVQKYVTCLVLGQYDHGKATWQNFTRINCNDSDWRTNATCLPRSFHSIAQLAGLHQLWAAEGITYKLAVISHISHCCQYDQEPRYLAHIPSWRLFWSSGRAVVACHLSTYSVRLNWLTDCNTTFTSNIGHMSAAMSWIVDTLLVIIKRLFYQYFSKSPCNIPCTSVIICRQQILMFDRSVLSQRKLGMTYNARNDPWCLHPRHWKRTKQYWGAV